MELGWASALAKPTMLVIASQAQCSPLIFGLAALTRVEQMDEPVAWHAAEVAEVAKRTIAMVDPGVLKEDVGTAGPRMPPDDRTPAQGGVTEGHLAFCSRRWCRHATSPV